MTANESREFDWCDDDVVVPQQPAIAIYLNPAGDVVLRQRGDVYDDDSWIWFGSEHALAVARAILEAVGLSVADLVPEPTQVRSHDTTAAERQRRYRERKKRESTPDIFDRDVADRNAVTRDGKAA